MFTTSHYYIKHTKNDTVHEYLRTGDINSSKTRKDELSKHIHTHTLFFYSIRTIPISTNPFIQSSNVISPGLSLSLSLTRNGVQKEKENVEKNRRRRARSGIAMYDKLGEKSKRSKIHSEKERESARKWRWHWHWRLM